MRMHECDGTKWYGLLLRRSKWINICVRGIKKKVQISMKLVWFDT